MLLTAQHLRGSIQYLYQRGDRLLRHCKERNDDCGRGGEKEMPDKQGIINNIIICAAWGA
jgi:hypothetical protein